MHSPIFATTATPFMELFIAQAWGCWCWIRRTSYLVYQVAECLLCRRYFLGGLCISPKTGALVPISTDQYHWFSFCLRLQCGSAEHCYWSCLYLKLWYFAHHGFFCIIFDFLNIILTYYLSWLLMNFSPKMSATHVPALRAEVTLSSAGHGDTSPPPLSYALKAIF